MINHRPSFAGWRVLALLLLLAVLAFAGCGGRRGKQAPEGDANTPSNNVNTPAVSQGPGRTTGASSLSFSSEASGDMLIVTLAASNAVDLYQIGGKLKFDGQALSFLAMTPGKAFGPPAERLELAHTGDGYVEFAISKRYDGPGTSGDFTVAEFRFRILASSPDMEVAFAEKPIVRDSKKADLELSAGGAK